MKILKATILNIDKPNKNGRTYSRDILEAGSVKYCEEPLFLFDRMPLEHETKPSCENIVGVCLEEHWQNNNTQLMSAFHLIEDKINNIDLTKVYPAMFGTGNMDADGNITEFNLQGYGLCENPAYETKIEIVDVDNYVRECSKGV